MALVNLGIFLPILTAAFLFSATGLSVGFLTKSLYKKLKS